MTDPQSAPMTAKHLQRWCCPQCGYSVTPNEILTVCKHFEAHALECVRCLYRTETKATWEEAKAEYTRAAASPRLAGREEIALEDALRIVDSHIGDLPVVAGKCPWGEVANAQTHIRGELRAAAHPSHDSQAVEPKGGEL